MTIMLQAGFILVLCGSFYQLTSFYANVNQVLTARNHAERVISFVDDKIRHAGLGLWRCGNSSAEVRKAFTPIASSGKILDGFRLPFALMVNRDDKTSYYLDDDKTMQYGSVLTVVYGNRDLSTGDDEDILIVTQKTSPTSGADSTGSYYESKLQLLDTSKNNPENVKTLFSYKTKNDQRLLDLYAVT